MFGPRSRKLQITKAPATKKQKVKALKKKRKKQTKWKQEFKKKSRITKERNKRRAKRQAEAKKKKLKLLRRPKKTKGKGMFKRLGRFIGKAARAVGRSGLGKIAKTAISTVVPGAGIAFGAASLLGSGRRRGAPGLPALPGGKGITELPPMGTTSGPGLLPRGPGGKMQFPWSDPSPGKMLKAWSLDDAYLTTYYRAPKGYVVARDSKGRPYCLKKEIARLMGWKPKKKPPISVRDWNALRRSYYTVNKLKRVVKMAQTVGNRRKSLSF